jgi:hypothetical protein
MGVEITRLKPVGGFVAEMGACPTKQFQPSLGKA